jgi:hypothetical protein
MPLKCLLDGKPIFSFALSSNEWDALKDANRREKHLLMPCCDAKATPKTSKLGTQFFAHSKTEGCASPAETAEHLLAKSIIANAAKNAGWEVDTEVAGCTPSGEQWIADVLATKGKSRIAIEVQWSRQDQEETKRRQERYQMSGVRGLWLLRHPTLLVEKGTPTFRLRYDEASKAFSVLLPSPMFHAAIVGNHNKDEPRYWQQTEGLAAFIVGALRGRLIFAPAIGSTLPVNVTTATTDCWKCKKETNIVISVDFLAGNVFKDHPPICTTIYDFDEIDGCDDFLETVFASELLRQHGIGAIKRRFSKTMKGRYLSNGCVHCDALQGRFFDHELWHEAETAYTVEAELSDRWACQLFDSNDEIMRWWFDEDTAISPQE